MSTFVVVGLSVAYLLALAVSWHRERRAGMWLERATLALLVVCVTGGFVAVTQQGRDIEAAREDAETRIRLAAEERAAQLKAEAAARAEAIQDSRREVIIRACREQNRRHHRTVARLDRLIADIPPGERRERAEQGRDTTVALIDQLAPRRDCARRAQRFIP